MPVYFKYISRDSPWLCIRRAISWTMFSAWASIILSGISMVAFSTTLATTASSFLEFASISFFSANFFSTSFLYSSKVSNSETSDANSSFNSGSSFTLISLTVTLKVAGFPARSAAWYSVGKVTFTSHSSPIFLPISCSSKVSIKEWEPMVNG